MLYQMYTRLHSFLTRRFLLTRFFIGSVFLFFVQLLVCVPTAFMKSFEFSDSFIYLLLHEYFYRFGSGVARVIDVIPGITTLYGVLLSVPVFLLIWSINLKPKWFFIAFILAFLLVLGPIDFKLLVTYF